MEKNIRCSCSDPEKCTVFACSGAADLGLASDLLARKLHANQARSMKCLAFVSAGIEEMIDSVRDTNMLVIDGCKLDCGKKTFEKNGLKEPKFQLLLFLFVLILFLCNLNYLQ